MLDMTILSRRRFLQQSAVATGAACVSVSGLPAQSRGVAKKEARYYTKLDDGAVQCTLCPWRCVVGNGKRGHCDVRENRRGIYYSLVYGRIAANHRDPIEKKPLFHFMPGTEAFSLATAGCNVDCKFCQNWELAQRRPEDIFSAAFTPEEIVEQALKYNCQSVAYTYNEPTVFTEFIIDTAAEARRQGVKSAVISNGYILKEPLLDLCRVVDAYKVDLKAFTESYYRDVVGGQLKPVLETLVTLKSQNVWTEIVYLTVPTLNDDISTVKDMVKWILHELGPDVPLHFSRFYPQYRLRNLPPTPIPTLEKLRTIGMDGGLNYVYLGNVPGHQGENTTCPNCGETLIGRMGYQIFKKHIKDGKCDFCKHPIPGVWS
jgi:pyruvate formate lyase activating enzyme